MEQVTLIQVRIIIRKAISWPYSKKLVKKALKLGIDLIVADVLIH